MSRTASPARPSLGTLPERCCSLGRVDSLPRLPVCHPVLITCKSAGLDNLFLFLLCFLTAFPGNRRSIREEGTTETASPRAVLWRSD